MVRDVTKEGRRDAARLYLAKAREDFVALEILSASDKSPLASIGFHGQQVCEKSFKAVLFLLAKRFTINLEKDIAETHSLINLASHLENQEIELPAGIKEHLLSKLTAYAVKFRYDSIPKPAKISREEVLASASVVLEWGENLLIG